MRNLLITLFLSAVLLPGARVWDRNGANPAQASPPVASLSAGSPLGAELIEKIVQREHRFNAEMRHLKPLVETYIQEVTDDPQNPVPVSDHYYLGRLQLDGNLKIHSFTRPSSLPHRLVAKLALLYELQFLPLGFAQMALLDDDFESKYYDFSFVRHEALGDVSCMVFQLQPRANAGKGRFSGTIWVEERDYNIVRFRGIYAPQPANGFYRYLHFDSWRTNVGPNLWLPAYIYSDEPDIKYGVGRSLSFRSQTRLWGYNLHPPTQLQEYTRIEFDTPGISDPADLLQDANPVNSSQQWEAETETRALDRLQVLGLLAAPGNTEKNLQNFIDTLIETNHLDIQGDVHARVLLTSPLESFTVGHTIVVSRGWLDMAPGQATIAAVLAREVSHIALGHDLNNDRILFREEDTVERLRPRRGPEDEDAAHEMTLRLLSNSIYKGDLPEAAWFVGAALEQAPQLKNLVHSLSNLTVEKAATLQGVNDPHPDPSVSREAPLKPALGLDTWNDLLQVVTPGPPDTRKPVPLLLTETPPILRRLQNGE